MIIFPTTHKRRLIRTIYKLSGQTLFVCILGETKFSSELLPPFRFLLTFTCGISFWSHKNLFLFLTHSAFTSFFYFWLAAFSPIFQNEFFLFLIRSVFTSFSNFDMQIAAFSSVFFLSVRILIICQKFVYVECVWQKIYSVINWTFLKIAKNYFKFAPFSASSNLSSF